ncbi:MAG: methylenetetrahydrofolate reductase [NAD(P)H] [Calditrichaeota bacterium]|nr:MAG: methylenetetrahydrofolate reductase [NAD(P)H] [Calditrichota bacterium]
MRISDILQKKERTFSFEYFPSKTIAGISKLYETIENVKDLNPDFVSVTYGAGGTTREKSFEIVNQIKNVIGLEVMSHFTCVGHNVEELQDSLDELQANNIDNILALRGDPPKGEESFIQTDGGYRYASDLVKHIRMRGHFCIGVAGYPEVHPEAPNRETDLKNLKFKVDQGADFVITQLFFNNDDYFRFVDEAARIGVHCKIIPGIMPITNFSQIKRFAKMCGAVVPQKLVERLEKVENDPTEVALIGIEYSMKQCRDLMERGAPGLHFYTLNKSAATRILYNAVNPI